MKSHLTDTKLTPKSCVIDLPHLILHRVRGIPSNSHLILHSQTINTNIIHDWTSKWALKGYLTLDTKWTLNWKRVRSGVFGEELFSQKV